MSKKIISIEKKLNSLPPAKVYRLMLMHLSTFNDFFMNISSYRYELEKQMGLRIEAKTLAPLSFIVINSVIYNYQNEDAPYHKEVIKLGLPIEEIKNHPLFNFEYTHNNGKFQKNTLDCISYNINYPRDTVRRHLKPWLKIGAISKNKEIGYYAPFGVILKTNLFKKTHFWISEKMRKSWTELLASLSNLNYIEKHHSIIINPIQKQNKNEYFKLWIMLHWYWSLSFKYINISPLTYRECCVLSSTLFFRDNHGDKLINEEKDFYVKEIIKPINLNSIADSTLIPRESVRRTVITLIKKNFLIKKFNKIYVNESIFKNSIVSEEQNKIIKKSVNDTLIIIANMFRAN